MKTTSDSVAKRPKKSVPKRPRHKTTSEPMPIPDEKTARFLKAVKGLKGIL